MAAGRPAGAAQAAAHGAAGLAAAGRRARRQAVGGDGVTVCGPPQNRTRPGPRRGQRAAGAPARRGGRGRLRRVPRDDRRSAGEAVAVRAAAVMLGPGVSCRVATQAQEAFLEGHVLAFESFGAVPGRIRYDNLKPAVIRVLRGRDRAEAERFIALRSHYGFDSFFCVPGQAGAHEKGGVEGEIGRFRRRHLVPVPSVASLAALNQRIAAADILDDGRVITGRPVTVAAAFAAEQPAMMALPAEMFDPARLLQARVDNRARICVRQNYYSVPARYAGRRVAVRLSAMSVEVLDGPRVVAVHERAASKYAEVLTLDHYLEVLRYKPGALPGATALAQARSAGAFTTSHQRYWDAARRARGDGAGTRALTEILLGHRTLPAAALTQAMDKAVASGALDPHAVLIDARRLARGPVSPASSRSARWPATTCPHPP